MANAKVLKANTEGQLSLSVVLAVHNEAKILPNCLDAVKTIQDELIIVDGESTDDTVAVAKKYGAKVISTTNKVNFHINKQMAMDAATGELVLQLDADEVIDDQLIAFIAELKKPESATAKQHQQYAAWWIKRRNYFLGKFLQKGGQYPDPAIRLYRNGKARLPQKDVHEFMQVDGETGTADGDMLHYGNPTFGDYLRKFNTYTSFKATQLEELHVPLNVGSSFKYLVWMPLSTFCSLYIRHRGYVDGVPGFVFASWSGLHHAVAYLKLWELQAHATPRAEHT